MSQPLHELPIQAFDHTQTPVIAEINDTNPTPVKDVLNATLTKGNIAGSLFIGGITAFNGHKDLKGLADAALAESVARTTNISPIPASFLGNPEGYLELLKDYQSRELQPDGSLYPIHKFDYTVHANGQHILQTLKPELVEAENHIHQIVMGSKLHINDTITKPAAVMAVGSLLASGLYQAGKKVYNNYKNDAVKEASDMHAIEEVLNKYSTLAKVAQTKGGALGAAADDLFTDVSGAATKGAHTAADLTANAKTALNGVIDKAKEMAPAVGEKFKNVASDAADVLRGADAKIVEAVKTNPRAALAGAALAAGAVGAAGSNRRDKYASTGAQMNIPEPMTKEASEDVDMSLIKEALSGK